MPGSDIALDNLPQVQIADARDIDTFFQGRKGQGYIKWFNSKLANQGPWQGVTLVDTPQNDIGFHQFWNQADHVFGGPINLIQFICLMSILSNECRGNFSPKTELMGIKGHPGMAYLFDTVPNLKRSYNTLDGNCTALQCFQNDVFINAHGSLALGSQLARTTDPRWATDTWPADFKTDSTITVSGFITQADFMKFRGRGFIQTTGRANYLPLIEFVQNYDGDNSTIDFYQHRWTGKDPADICFETTNDDWDALFQKTDLIIATEAVRVHSQKSGNYLALSTNPAALNGTGPGSAFFMGKKISGGDAYAQKFKDRVALTMASV